MVQVVVPVLFVLASALAAAGTSDKQNKQEKSIAENTFNTADKDSNQKLDEDELREARRILRTVLLKGVPSNIFGGKTTREKIEELANKSVKGSKSGVTLEDFVAFVKSVLDQRDGIVKDANKKAADELAKQKQQAEEARRKAQEAAKRQHEKKSHRRHKKK